MISSTRSISAVASLAITALCLGGFSGCADFSRGDPSGGADGALDGNSTAPDGGATDAVTSSFALTVQPLLLSACQRCHGEGGEASDSSFLLNGDPVADLAATSPLVDVTTPSSSRLLSKMSGNGHGGGTVFAVGSPEYQIVLRWIQQGARP